MVANSAMSNNSAQSGGAISVEGPIRMEITDTSLFNNSGSDLGGALTVVNRSEVYIRASVLDSNRAEMGGAIRLRVRQFEPFSLTSLRNLLREIQETELQPNCASMTLNFGRTVPLMEVLSPSLLLY